MKEGQDYQLGIIEFPQFDVTRRISLLSEEMRQAIAKQNRTELYLEEVRNVVTNPTQFRWSPNGRYLAFTSALDVQSTDVCVYDIEQDSVHCLTNGHHLAIVMGWSPDSTWIVYGEASHYLYDPFWPAEVDEGVWVVSVAGDVGRELYPANPNSESILGWTSNNTLVAETWTFEGPSVRLQEVDVETGYTWSLYDAPFNNAALDPQTRTLIVNVSGFLFWSPTIQEGLYRLTAEKRIEPQILFSGSYHRVTWLPQVGQFAAAYDSQNSFVFAPAGEAGFKLDRAARLHPSPDGQWILTESFGGELNLYDSNGIWHKKVSEASGYERIILWLPDSTAFYLSTLLQGPRSNELNSGTLYRYGSSEGWEPVRVDEDIGYYPGATIVTP